MSDRPWRVCFVDPDKVEEDKGRSPNCRHTPCPRGYLNWHVWAERQSKTHQSTACPHCGLWAVWVPKGKRAPRDTKAAVAKALKALST